MERLRREVHRHEQLLQAARKVSRKESVEIKHNLE